ncbi:hypothetical protein K432DRAFT_311268, partial [Lepidopterella palustris CBS 459.81]
KVFAYTQRPRRIDRYDQIQICPWFLEYAMKDSYRFKNDVKADLLARMALKLDELVTDKWYTPVDLIMLFDKVTLHELTHTWAGTETIDVGGRSGYGWKNYRALSTVVTNPTTQAYGPEKNAGMFSGSNISRNTPVPLLTDNNEKIHMQFSRLVGMDQLTL